MYVVLVVRRICFVLVLFVFDVAKGVVFVGYCYVCAVLLSTYSAVFGCVGFLSMVCG